MMPKNLTSHDSKLFKKILVALFLTCKNFQLHEVNDYLILLDSKLEPLLSIVDDNNFSHNFGDKI